MGIKGQKINPVGWRLGFYRKWKTLWFEDSWNYGLMLNKTLKINELIQSFLLYKRFSALNINTLVLNQGTEKFTILVHFYNLREEETSEVKKQRKKKKGSSKFQSVRILWKFEQKYLKSSNFIKNKVSFRKKYKVLAELSKRKPFYSKKHLLNQKKIGKILKKNNTNREVPFKTLYLSSFTRRKIDPIKKFKPVLLKNRNNSSLFQLNSSIVENSLSIGLESQISFLFVRSPLNISLGISLKKILSIFLQKNYHLILAFEILKLKKEGVFELSDLAYRMNFYLKAFHLLDNFLLCSVKEEILLKPSLSLSPSKKSIHYSFLKREKTPFIKKDLFLLWKLKSSSLNFSSLPIVIQELGGAKEKSLTNNFKKRKLQKEASIDKKLVVIREVAIKRKFKRLNLEEQSSLWDLLVEPLLKQFENKEVTNFSLSSFKNRVLRIFLEKMSYHIYNTLSKLSKAQVLELIDELKKESLERSKGNISSKKKTSSFDKYSKWLETKFNFVNEQWYFSLEHLQKSMEFILNSRINVFFINDLSFLKFKSRLIGSESFSSTRFYGLKFLAQKIRLEKINSNRQYQKLLKEPFLIERRGKRRGPFLRDFVLLVLIALVTRSFLPLLRFIDFQMRSLAKTKRQIPFLRFLIRLISNLGGSLIKIKGLRIQFKGRFDRWNRTKSLIFTSGNIPFQRKNKDIEYASTHGLVKKGVFGIRFWVWYGSNYHQTYYDTFTSYWYFKQK